MFPVLAPFPSISKVSVWWAQCVAVRMRREPEIQCVLQYRLTHITELIAERGGGDFAKAVHVFHHRSRTN